LAFAVLDASPVSEGHTLLVPKRHFVDAFEITQPEMQAFGVNAGESAGQTVIGPQGIFKPKDFQFPLSITTSPDSPYGDAFSPDGYLLYKYRGTDPNHPDNVGLRQAGARNIPLVYFHGLIKGKYLATWPVFIRADDPRSLQFSVSVDDKLLAPEKIAEDPETPIRRRYATMLVRQRIHQQAFRERVVAAYRSQCAMCRLRHASLLDAAHIVPDSEEGEPKVSNGLALCKLHHAAFDSFLVSVTPDYNIQVRESVLKEEDGPILEHGLKGIHGVVIQLPNRTSEHPDRDSLARHFEKFQTAA
jgi:putative restriction endonuclease